MKRSVGLGVQIFFRHETFSWNMEAKSKFMFFYLLYLQAKSRSSASSTAAIGGSPTVRIARNIRTSTLQTSRTTARCVDATNPTRILRPCVSTWRYTARAHLPTALATTRTTRTTTATVTALRQAPRHRRLPRHPRGHLIIITPLIITARRP